MGYTDMTASFSRLLFKIKTGFNSLVDIFRPKTIGLTISDDIKISKDHFTRSLSNHYSKQGRYILNTNANLHFKITDVISNSKKNKVFYAVVCIETQDKFNLSDKLFRLLFTNLQK